MSVSAPPLATRHRHTNHATTFVGEFLVLFMLIFGPVLNTPIGFFADTSFFTAIIIIFYYFIIKRTNTISQYIVLLSLILLFISAFAILNTIFLDSNNTIEAIRAISRPIRALVIFLGLYSFAASFAERHGYKAFDLGISLAFYAVVLHALIMIFEFVWPAFREFMASIVLSTTLIKSYLSYRMPGLAGAGGAQVSMAQSLGLILACHMIVKPNIRHGLIVGLGFFLIIISLVLSGRSGFVILLIFIPLSFVFYSISEKRMILGPTIVKTAILFSVAIVLSALFYDSLVDKFPSLETAVLRTTDTWHGYQRTGQFNDLTLNALAQMFIIPQNFLHLLFGKASYLQNNGIHIIPTDIGYFLIIWGYGFLGSLLHYLFYFILIYNVIGSSFIDRRDKLICILLLGAVLLFNAKEIVVFSKMSFPISVFPVIILLFRQHIESTVMAALIKK